ncbi:class I SAM-dependent methyltransferase [Polynucleobacter paneuropaeus]|nr:class I SAM-dependent methyltransferase [Polynucleobacter paneuropaeus]
MKYVSEFPKDLLLVEIGCGDGSFLKELLMAGFNKVIGLEPSPSYHSIIDNDLVLREYAQDFFQKIPEASVGGVIAWDVFEHIAYHDIQILLKLIKLALIPNGLLIVRVPNMASPFGMMNFFGDISHVSALNEHAIRQIAFETGMILECVYPEPFSYPKNLMTLMGIIIWPAVNLVMRLSYSAFGIRGRVFTPNAIFILRAK